MIILYERAFLCVVAINCVLYAQNALELVEIVEEALRSGASAQPLSSPLELHRQVVLANQSASMFSIENEVHTSCCVEFYLQVQDAHATSHVHALAQYQIERATMKLGIFCYTVVMEGTKSFCPPDINKLHGGWTGLLHVELWA